MCGILFVQSEQPQAQRYEAALQKLKPRGPDKQASEQIGSYFLGHTRLSIIDINDRSDQPFFSIDRRYVLLYNGEIYNFREIKRCLINEKDIAFSTEGDTEVLLAALIHFGLDRTLKMVRGMFAFVFCDLETREVVCARDRFGQKPLYFYNKDEIVLASNVLAIKEVLNGVKPSVNNYRIMMAARGSHGTRCLTPSGDTLFEDIHSVRAGEYIRISADGIFTHEAYFTVSDLVDPVLHNEYASLSEDALQDRLDFYLRQSVERHLVSDVDVGVLLSGGLDSSLVYHYAHSMGEDLSTFIKVSPDIEVIPQTVIPQILREYPAHSYTVLQHKKHYLTGLISFIKQTGYPSRWGGGPPMASICAKARQNDVIVLLGGDGVDEYFCGYGHYFPYIQQTDDLLDLGDLVDIEAASPFVDSSLIEAYRSPEVNIRQQILDTLDHVSDSKDKLLSATLIHDVLTFLQNVPLPHSDAYSMMESVELRNPMLDIDLVRFSMNLSVNKKTKRLQNQEGKYLVRKLARDKMGNFINVKKEGTRNYAMAVANPEFWRFDDFLTLKDLELPLNLLNIESLSTRDVVRLINLEIFHRVFVSDQSEDDCLALLTTNGLKECM